MLHSETGGAEGRCISDCYASDDEGNSPFDHAGIRRRKTNDYTVRCLMPIATRPSDWTGIDCHGVRAQTRWTGPCWRDLATVFADVTGDGKADAIAKTNGGLFVRPSDGTAFLADP